MDLEEEVIDLSSDDSEVGPFDQEARKEARKARRAVLELVITRVVDALGGVEDGEYRLGDQVSACLKDLKKLWKRDHTDDERTVARIFWETRVLVKDLVPILLITAGKGFVEDKRAIAVADLITAMTWPIDMAEELKELEEDMDKEGADYTQLLESHLHYKSALLKPGVLQALFGIMLPPLTKPPKERADRDSQVVNVILHLIRNLAFIKDLPVNTNVSVEQAELTTLQSKLIRTLSETHTLQLILTIASNSNKDPLFNSWNTLVLEILYLLLRGTSPSTLCLDQNKQPSRALADLVAAENKVKQQSTRKAASRHSRFGTTISVRLNPKAGKTADPSTATEPSKPGQSFVIHRQRGLHEDVADIWDITKKQKARRAQNLDALSRLDNLSTDAKVVLQTFATDFIEACFNPFLSSVLKDIRSERPKIVEKDHVRLLFITKWFLDYFLSTRKKQSEAKIDRWEFGLIAEVTERQWIVWVLKRMRMAIEEKPKLWTEMQAGIECLTQFFNLIDSLTSFEIEDLALQETAELLQQQLIYNGEVLDITLDSLRHYKEGTQSLRYLDASIQMAYNLLRMLERWSKGKGEVYVRQKKTRRKKGGTGDDEVPEAEDVVDEPVIHETMFTFEAFEARFASADITESLLSYLSGWADFRTSENMKWVVNLIHRQAVRAKAEGLYFQVSTLNLFKLLLKEKTMFPREQPYKDLMNVINYILRQFFKSMETNPLLIVEAFYPKNRSAWKQYSSWEPEAKGARNERAVEDMRLPPEVQVKKGFSWSEQLGIVIAVLVEKDQKSLVQWTVEILSEVIRQREKIIEETDQRNDDDDDNVDAAKPQSDAPSAEAQAKMKDYAIPYSDDEMGLSATKNPQLKLLFKLCKFYIVDEDAEDELDWYVPAAILPVELRRSRTVILQFLEVPISLDGKRASDLLSKKSRRKHRRRFQTDSGNEDEEQPIQRKKREKKKKEEQNYKSAEFIEDSDDERYGNLEEFLAQEQVKRDAALAKAGASLMKPTGTKKRRRKDMDGTSDKAKSKRASTAASNASDTEPDALPSSDSERDEPLKSPPAKRPRPRPKPKAPGHDASSITDWVADTDTRMGSPAVSSPSRPTQTGQPPPTIPLSDSEDNMSETERKAVPIRRARLVLSDDEDD